MLQNDTLDTLNRKLALARTQFAAGSLQEQRALRCCELAMEGLLAGSYGVGALLYDADDQVLAEASNQVFGQDFNSAAHAEMRVLDQFEALYPDYGSRKSLTLLSSLEPCPMCLTRILAAGIGRLEYLAPDPEGGQAGHVNRFPPAWRNLARLCHIRPLRQPIELHLLAFDIADAQKGQLRRKLIATVRP